MKSNFFFLLLVSLSRIQANTLPGNPVTIYANDLTTDRSEDFGGGDIAHFPGVEFQSNGFQGWLGTTGGGAMAWGINDPLVIMGPDEGVAYINPGNLNQCHGVWFEGNIEFRRTALPEGDLETNLGLRTHPDWGTSGIRSTLKPLSVFWRIMFL